MAASRSACSLCHRRKIRCDVLASGVSCSNCKHAGRTQAESCQIHEKKRRLVHGGGPSDTTRDARLPQIRRPPASYVEEPVEPVAADDKEFQRHLVRFIDQRDIDKRAIHQGIRITYLGTSVSNINFLVRRRSGATNPDVYHYPTDQISRHLTCMPSYFVHINRGYSILDEDIFMSQYQGRNPSNPPSLLALHSALMVGVHLSCPRPEREQLKSLFFHRAKMLHDARFERDRDVVVQAALLLSWYSDGAEDVCANAWYWIGVAARTAQGLGIHRETEPSIPIEQDKRIWRRKWWMLVSNDVLVSLFYGRPTAINLDDCDVRELFPGDFCGCSSDVKVDLQLHRSAICRIIARALRLFRPNLSDEECRKSTYKADSELACWYLDLPESLRYDSSQHSKWAAQLLLIYHNVLILLHRPRGPKSPTPAISPSSTSSLSRDAGVVDGEICNSSAQAIVNIFEKLCAHDEIKYLWLDAANALFTALTHLSTQIAPANSVLAAGSRLTFQSGLRALRMVAEWWPMENAVVELFESERSHPKPEATPSAATAPKASANPTTTPTEIVKGNADGISALLLASAAGGLGHSYQSLGQSSSPPGPSPNNQLQNIEASDWRHLYPFSEIDQIQLFENDQSWFDGVGLQWQSNASL